jgi:hypothetical protein
MTPYLTSYSTRRVVVVLLCALVCAPLVAPAPAGGATERYRFQRAQSTDWLGSYTRTWGAAWVDHDNDGDPDVFLGRHQYVPWLFERTSHSFGVSREGAAFIKADRHNCAWGEANGDGAPDLYCTIGAQRGKGEGPNQLYVRTSGGYEERAEQFGVTNPKGRGRSVNWIDYDSDGDLDIFVGNRERPIAPAAMYRNDNDTFHRAETGLEEPDVSNSTWADWDNDGDPDLLVLPGNVPPIAYENEGGAFTRVSLHPATTRVWKSAAWGDYNADGWIDVHLVRRKRAVVLRNSPSGFLMVDPHPLVNGRMSEWLDLENDGDLDLFIVKGATGLYPGPEATNYPDVVLVNKRGVFEPLRQPALAGPSKGSGDTVTVTDYDRDGRTDILVTNGYQTRSGPLWLIHNLSVAGRWLGIDLVGPPNNPLAYGARITVTTSTRTYRRQLTDGVGFRSQSEVGYTTFGVGDARSAQVELLWPDGTTSCYSTPTNRSFTAVHGTAACG